MKIPLLIPSLILLATLLGCGKKLEQEPATSRAKEKVDLAPETKALIETAEKGDADAQVNLGWMYANGQGVTKDEVEAVKWFRKAADQGNADGQSNLGLMYENGRGVAKDEVEAYKWWLLAGAQGNEFAKENIPLIERDLTAAQRAEGQRLAREWKSKK